MDLERLLVIDVETVSQQASYTELNETWQALWGRKASNLKADEGETAESLYKRAGIYAEFGKVVCISFGIFRACDDHYQFRLKSFSGHDEKEVLNSFADLLNTRFDNTMFAMVAHNGKEFDFPYLSRRMLVNNIRLPLLLNTPGKKPWEVNHLDTMELWKFGDFKSYTSLNLLASVFDIPTPKDDIDGSMVGDVYWKERDLERITRYCQKDVLTVAQLILRFKGLRLLNEEQIIFAAEESRQSG